jgi:hypothetical protein
MRAHTLSDSLLLEVDECLEIRAGRLITRSPTLKRFNNDGFARSDASVLLTGLKVGD